MASVSAVLPAADDAGRASSSLFAGCNYKALAAAKVGNAPNAKAEAVEVSFCGRSATLHNHGPVSDPFDGVEWWDAS